MTDELKIVTRVYKRVILATIGAALMIGISFVLTRHSPYFQDVIWPFMALLYFVGGEIVALQGSVMFLTLYVTNPLWMRWDTYIIDLINLAVILVCTFMLNYIIHRQIIEEKQSSKKT